MSDTPVVERVDSAVSTVPTDATAVYAVRPHRRRGHVHPLVGGEQEEQSCRKSS